MVLGTLGSCVQQIWECLTYLDLSYLSWLLWIFYPCIISFLLPCIIAILLYASALFLWIFQYRERIRAAYHQDMWDGARKTLAALWAGQGYIFHGFEVDGLEHIPDTGSAMIIYYHGVLPIDMYYIMATCLLEKGRSIYAVGDKFLFKIPGWRRMMEVLNVTTGTAPRCLEILANNNLLAIAPGGVREALFADENYSIMWGKRSGFADVALQANVPVIPMFTENCREAFRTPKWGRTLLRRLYEWSRLPLVPIYGLFPVKLITHFGEPIYPQPGMTVMQFRELVKEKVEELIQRYQRLPGNIPRAMWQRAFYKTKER
ncbi:DGAT1/2-independent enzyme synthesizing storage lipids-like [Babylonia areolata]|uniref:DGAT1/2-independent enzyme synthesizing storage lipids-like n=1 Tax=Babylonia areolata TaxID=304850 RepID=UPI003FD160D8